MTIFKERGITHLDLHGTKHQDVDAEVRNFIFQYQDSTYQKLKII